MAGSNERELKLKLTVEAPDPSKPAKAFQDIATQAQRASLAVQDAQKHMQRIQGGPGSGHGLPGGGVSASAIMGVPQQQQRTGWAATAAPSNTAGSSTAAANQAWVADRARVIAAQDAANHFNQLNYRQYWAQSHMWAPPAQQQSAAPIINPRPGDGGSAASAAAGVGGGLGIAGKALGFVGAGLASIEAVTKFSDALFQLDNKFVTTRDKVTDFVKVVPLVGDALAGMTDRFLSMIERWKDPVAANALDERRVTAPREMAYNTALAKHDTRADSLRREVAYAGFGEDAIRARPLFSSTATRNRNGTEWEQQAEIRMFAAKDATALAGRSKDQAIAESAYAMTEAKKQAGRLSAAEEAERAAKLRFDRADKASKSGDLGKNELERARLEYNVALNRSLAEGSRNEAAITEAKQKQIALVQKELEYRKAQTGEMKAHLSILEEEAKRSKDAARSFGAMDSVNQRGALDALERFKRGGRDQVSGSELSVLQQLTPDIVNKELDKENKSNPLVKEFLKAAGMRDEETINKEIGKLEAKINLKVEIDEANATKTMKDALEKLNLKEIMQGVVRNQFRIEMEQFRINQGAGRL